jgi:hypothetical protein
VDDGELRYWAERGVSISGSTRMIDDSWLGETKQLWRIVGELAHRVLELKEERDGS